MTGEHIMIKAITNYVKKHSLYTVIEYDPETEASYYCCTGKSNTPFITERLSSAKSFRTSRSKYTKRYEFYILELNSCTIIREED